MDRIKILKAIIKKNRLLLYYAIFTLIFGSNSVFALPNTGVDAIQLPEGILLARERFFYSEYKSVWNDTQKRYDDLRPGEYHIRNAYLTDIAYGINKSWTVAASLWFYDAKINDGSYQGSDRGIGDLYFYSKNRLFTSRKNPRTGISNLLGLRLPTGDYKELPVLGLGDGSTDIGFGFAGTHEYKKFSNSLAAWIWYNAMHKDGFNDKHELEIRTTSIYDIAPRKFNVQMELKNLLVEGGDRYLVEFVPGIQYTPVFPLTFQLSAKLPLMEKGYYSYDYQLMLGVSFGFPIK